MSSAVAAAADLRRLRPLDPKLWKACAGTTVKIPAVHSAVFYFPQGHIEHSSEPITLSASLPSAAVPCLVRHVLLAADSNSDEVFAALRLEPANAFPQICVDNEEKVREEENEEGGIVSFAKVLTPSDANNGGGFSVPRFCADSIFPALDYEADPPVQNVRIRDVQGEVWDFRHIYRGTPRRHLLTTGWSKFVNAKKLTAGDSVVFMRDKRSGEMAVGIRRAVRSGAAAEFVGRMMGHCAFMDGRMMMMGLDEGMKRGEGFSRSGKGKVLPGEVVEAVNRAAKGLVFEVVYYPRAGSAEFVVEVEKVEKALKGMCWSTGVRIKMAMETEDSSRIAWFQGTVASVAVPESGMWRGSPWRMLQVAWDEPEVLHNVKKVSPWEVEYVAPTPLPTVYPLAKRLRVSHGPMFLTEGQADFPLPMIGSGNSMLGQFSPSHMNSHTFPAGMQGARQDTSFVFGSPNFVNGSRRQVCATDDSNHTMALKEDAVSTVLNIGASRFTSPPDSANSVELLSSHQRARSSPVKTLQLFGKIIHVETPLQKSKDVCSTKDVDSQVYEDTEGRMNKLEFPLSRPYKKLLDELSVQCQTAPVA
ncbi:hypothetical protein Droror1_Dr00004766 [Drosera rotundifolia]